MTIKNVAACRERANSPASKRQSVVGWGVVMASFHDRLKTGCEAVRPYLGAPPPPDRARKLLDRGFDQTRRRRPIWLAGLAGWAS